MKKLKLMFAAIMVAVVSMLAVSCSKSDDNSESRDTYSVVASISGGGLNTETLKAMEDSFNKEGKDVMQNVTYIEANVAFNTFSDKMETYLKKQFSNKLTEALTVKLTLTDSKGNYKMSKDFTIPKGYIYSL